MDMRIDLPRHLLAAGGPIREIEQITCVPYKEEKRVSRISCSRIVGEAYDLTGDAGSTVLLVTRIGKAVGLCISPIPSRSKRNQSVLI